MAATAFTEITTGLQFPEGPVAMPDGSVILTEMFASRLTRVAPDGTKTTVAEINGGPNGLAVGPDGALYLCNNGNAFTPLNVGGMMYPGPFDESRYIGGRIQRVDIATGTVTDLYTHCGATQLRAPNDIVFDKQGGFYFTDHGVRTERSADRTGIYYAKTDGSFIEEVAFPVDGPNGIGLSPDEKTVYWAETHTGRVYQRAI
ncbi:MAG: SMP-30/gluconolactonase/LRE family protein, partial [Actinobacteria bacterium]|nr:SMP-30/gluconolactonase/LRE family protein [Actinomycetota bacterium]